MAMFIPCAYLFYFRSVFGYNLVHRVNSCTVGISKCVFTFDVLVHVVVRKGVS